MDLNPKEPDPKTFEVYLLILKTLEGGPNPICTQELRRKLEQYVVGINETRVDFLGNQHAADLNQILARYPNINAKTLSNICENLKKNLDTTMPLLHAPGTTSYLGAGGFSLLRSPEVLKLEDIRHSYKSLLTHKHYSPAYKNHSLNIQRHLQARKVRGSVAIRRTLPTELYTRMHLYKRIMGHLSSVYCLCFDQTGQYILTGADDHLIKIWSATDGRLLKTLRGHEGEITDMSVNYENRLVASGGMDRIIRVWDLKTTKLIDCLAAHTAMVTSVKFSPYNRHGTGKDRYLISTSNDGSVVFWKYHVDNFKFEKIQKYKERNRPGGRIICSSFSTGGSFLACGSSDNYIHVYGFAPDIGPYWMSELDAHKDQVDSIQFSNTGSRFITGSQDGTAIIWTYKGKPTGADWVPLKLDMNTRIEDQTIAPLAPKQAKPRVLIVQWSRDDRFVMTSIVDYTIRVWDSNTGRLVYILSGHKHDVYLIESHPVDPRICLSASHDGVMILWDLDRGKPLKKFQNRVEIYDPPGATIASIYDAKFSPDGNMIATTDSYGYLTIYGNASNEYHRHLPEQMFFHTDYRALIRDMQGFVMDEQTHIAPHLMPKPTLVDMNGNPYPPSLQGLVTDFTHRPVIPPMTKTQINCIAQVISEHSILEDRDFLEARNKYPESQGDQMFNIPNVSAGSSRYNTRNSTRNSHCATNNQNATRHSFRAAQRNFRSQRTNQPESDSETETETEDEAEVEAHAEPAAETDSGSETDANEDEDAETLIDSEATEIDSDATEVDSEATEIDEPSNSERQVSRRSARLRDRKRLRAS